MVHVLQLKNLCGSVGQPTISAQVTALDHGPLWPVREVQGWNVVS